ncbi:MAG: hypothetical protein LVQ97_01820 [Candidatus Micrarchaeales archaeon]|jgi:hypothetical protein|uniref:Uncharacterized protein n=1 Tax=Candidatus Micrarchaeum acidiphilum ARMAN-2 TaxID=425595 RepID=C7DI80_MICA2|nr:MAG: hypothetical protein UNLARM2_0772 [Candidatus Micrarchaeum acidiphilum ARMAN-2]MCW6160904.1 hypothetical protein [Candidatus Micrarchaeales archaeon]
MEKYLANATTKPANMQRKSESTPETATYYQAWRVSLNGYPPSAAFSKPGHWIQYHLTRDMLNGIISDWDNVASWGLSRTTGKAIRPGNYHPAAKSRKNPAAPLTAYLRIAKDDSGPKNILYHGVGRDAAGASALSRGGVNTVSVYDPFHPDEKVRTLCAGPFDEIHSHYTLNVVDKPTGKLILTELHTLLRDGGTAIVSVRDDI